MKRGRTLIEKISPSNSESVTDFRLPQDLITEILLYLPVKSLLKFKCVSKPWRCLISSPQFIKAHFATSSNHQLLFTTQAPNSGMKQCSLSAALHNPSTRVCDIEYPSLNPNAYVEIVGIVNGLLCLAIWEKKLYWENELCLWNPNLKKCKHLPSSNFCLKDGNDVSYGVGYNASNDDYKVVAVNHIEGVYERKVKVYSVRADSWRSIEDFQGDVHCDSGTYGNGKIWWTARRTPASGGNWKIVSLDMGSDKYEEVQGPVHEAGACSWAVTVLGGRIYVLCDHLRKKLDLWVMNKFGVEESWSKVVSVPYNDFHDPTKPHTMDHVVCISRNGEFVFEDRLGGLFVYSSKDKEFRKIQLVGLRSFSQVFVYAESLVSPNGM